MILHPIREPCRLSRDCAEQDSAAANPLLRGNFANIRGLRSRTAIASTLSTLAEFG
jgi:hypothetical protein